MDVRGEGVVVRHFERWWEAAGTKNRMLELSMEGKIEVSKSCEDLRSGADFISGRTFPAPRLSSVMLHRSWTSLIFLGVN